MRKEGEKRVTRNEEGRAWLGERRERAFELVAACSQRPPRILHPSSCGLRHPVRSAVSLPAHMPQKSKRGGYRPPGGLNAQPGAENRWAHPRAPNASCRRL